MSTIYIVRHGETLWNAEGRIQGHTDVDLTEKGREQARATARRLSGIPFHVAYSSDMSRTRDTALVILGERSTPLHSVPELREYNKGVFEGLTPEEYRRRYPDLFQASLVNDLDFDQGCKKGPAPLSGPFPGIPGQRPGLCAAGRRDYPPVPGPHVRFL